MRVVASLTLLTLAACGGGDSGSVAPGTPAPLVEVEENDDLQQLDSSAPVASLLPGDSLRLQGRIHGPDGAGPVDPERDAVDGFRFSVMENVQVQIVLEPQEGASLGLLLAGEGGNSLLTGVGVLESAEPGASVQHTLDLPAEVPFYVVVLSSGDESDYELRLEVGPPSGGALAAADEGSSLSDWSAAIGAPAASNEGQDG